MNYREEKEYKRLLSRAANGFLSKENEDRLNFLGKLKVEMLQREKDNPKGITSYEWDLPPRLGVEGDSVNK